MTDVETRLRATLHAVAEATDTDRVSPYVEAAPSPRSRRPLLLAMAAAAVVVVVGAAVTALPSEERAPTTVPASPPAEPPLRAGPEGGRPLAEGRIGDERWVLYGVDRLPNMNDETPCFKLIVGTREHTPGGCGIGGDDASDRIVWWQLGPVVEADGDVLVLGVLDGKVDHVVVELADSKRSETIRPHVDPAHPDGARYVLYVAPRSERSVRLTFTTAAGRILEVSDVRVDGTVGG